MNAADRLAARVGIPLESRFFEAAAGRLHCKVAGSGPPLLLIHGLNIGWGQWHEVVAPLAAKFTVYAIDLPGAGESVKPDFLTADMPALMLDAVDAALREFCPTGALVAGHSVGGWAALRLAADRHPAIRKVVAVDAMGFTDFVPPRYWALAWRPSARLLAAKLVPPTRRNLEDFLNSVTAVKTPLAAEYVDYFFEHVNTTPTTHPFLLIHSLFRPGAVRIRPELVLSPSELGDIICPTVIAHGAADPLIPLRSVRPAFAAVRGSKEVIFDGVGHALPLEFPSGFVRLIMDAA